MKKRLFTSTLLALTTMFMLPFSVWADGEVTISGEKTWVFDDLSSTSFQSGAIEAQGFYVRASSTATTRQASTASTLTFADGYTVENSQYYLNFPANATVNVSNTSKPWDNVTTNYNAFAFSATVTGTVYVKIQGTNGDSFRIYYTDGTSVNHSVLFTATGGIDEIAYTLPSAGNIFVVDVTNSYKIYGVRFVPSTVVREKINSKKTWLFNNNQLIGVGSVTYVNDGLYMRGYATNGKNVNGEKTFTIESGTATINGNKFGGSLEETISKIAVSHGDQAGVQSTNVVKTPSDYNTSTPNELTPTVAFETSVAGTAYAVIKAVSATQEGRVFWSDGSSKPSISGSTNETDRVSISNTTDLFYVTKTSTKPGSFFIGGTKAYNLYAVRFIPSVEAPTFSQNGNTITISAGTCHVDNATLTTYYTTDGTEPSSSNKMGSFSGANGDVAITANTTIKAITVTNTETIYSAVATSEEFTYISATEYILSYSTGQTAAGNIAATVDGAKVNSGSSVADGKTVTMTATINDGYQFVEWTDGEGHRLSTLSEYSFEMTAATTIKAVFKATPTTPVAIETQTVWTFDEFTANTNLFPTTSTANRLYDFNNLYITGHANNNPAKILAKESAVSTAGVTDGNVTNYLYLAGAQNSELKHNRDATSITPDAIAFKTGSNAGMVYVAIKGTTSSDTRYVNIYEAIGTTASANSTSANKYQTETTGSIQAVEHYIASNANVFIGTSAGAAEFYAVKFVPETVGKPTIEQATGSNTVTITAGTSSFAEKGATVDIYYTTNGDAPTTSSTKYTEAFSVTSDCTVKAICVSSGGTVSEAEELACTFTPMAVSITKNWTFGELTTNTTYNAVTLVGSEYYLRGSSESPNRNFTVKDLTEATQLTFADGISVNATKLIEANGQIVTKVSADNDVALTATSTAGDATKCGMPTFAFNASVAGTCYAKVKYTGNTSTSVRHRIYFANGTTIVNSSIEATSGIDEVSFTSTEAGSFFIGDISGNGKYEIYAVRFVPTTEAVKYTLTVPTVNNATITAKVGETTIAEGENAEVVPGSEVTLTAVPDAGYQLVGWKDGNNAALGAIPQSLVTTVAMPPAALTATATFEAQPETPTAITTEKIWTFDGFTTGTTLAGTKPYEYDGLYINGHADNNLATITSGAASALAEDFGGTAVNVNQHLYVAGAPNSTISATTSVNSTVRDAVAFRAGVPGTVYALISGNYATGRTFDIYVNGTKKTTAQVSGNAPKVISQELSEAANVFIATSGGECKFYAVKFVPAPTYAISKSEMTNGDVTIDPASASAGQTVTLTVVPADGYRLKSGTLKATYNNGTEQTLTIENNQFTMPAYAVTVSAEFELLSPIYGTYDFKTFATENITFAENVTDAQAVPELSNGMLTGNFTLDETKGTFTSGSLPMVLNEVFGVSDVSKSSLRKNSKEAYTGLLMAKSASATVTINRLSAGDWFVIEGNDKVLFKTANANIKKLGQTTTIAANEAVESGVKYIASAATAVELYNNNVDNSYIYSVTISKDEAISDPAIGDLSEGKVTITAGESTASGSVKTYYTIDGSVPTASSTAYTEAVAIDQTRIVKAVTINTTTNVVSNVVTKKIVVDAATPTTTWDFVNDATLNPLTYADETYNGYYINSSGASKGDGKFKYVTNEKIHAKLSWQLEGTETANALVGENGLSIRKGGRAFAINDLHVGDKIFITYSNTGETPLKTSINENHGCSISVDGGETVSSGNTTEIASGAEIIIKSAPEGYEYLVLMPADNKITIQKIEINPSFTVTNLTASNSGVTGVKVIKVDDETVDETFASGETKSFIRGSKVTLKASYTAETGKSLLWLDAEDNELESNADGTLTLTVDADMKVKAQYVTGITVTEVKNSDNKMVARKLNNGLLEVTFDNNGRITAIKDIKSGKEVMASDDNNQRGYFNFNYRPSKDAKVIDFGLECNSSGDIVQMGKTGSTQVELIYPLADAATPSHQTWKIGYVMKAGVSGIYTYAIMDGSSSYSELHEARYGWRVNPDIFNYAWVSDGKQGQMPTPTQMKNYVEEVQDATYKLNDGSIYTKYDWANFVKDDQLHGIMGDGIGAWLISPSTEWVNGGPQKQELTVHATDTTPIILQTMHSRHFGAGAAVLGSSDKKMFGPCLFYVNTGASQEAMIQDAKSKAAEETGAWPYSWFTNDNDIKSGLALTASERGTVTGTVNVNGGFETTKVQVVLTQGSEKPLLDANGYQYYAEATAGSSFEIKNVRPGTYTLYVYALNGDATGTYKKEEVTVSAGSTALGTIDWSPEKYGKTLWRIGEADRSTKGFKLSDEQRHYGLWSSVPTDDQTFTIGTNNEADDWYYAQVKDGGSWAIKFNCEEAFKMPLRLTIATAGAAQTPKLEAKMNDKLLNTDGSIAFSNDASIYRSGVLGGRDSLIVFEVPAAYMKTGENILNLKVNGLSSGVGGIMYDCIKLEASAEAVVSETRNWTFGDLATGTTYKEVTPINNEYYLRGSGTTNRNFTVKASATQEFTFADGQKVSATNYLEANGGQVMKVTTANDAAIAGSNTAGDATNAGTPTFAFNTTKAGTVYAKISSNTAEKLLRVYFANGSSVISTGSTFKPSTTDITEISYTSKEAGTFFICGAEAAFKIHAVRFVPTDEAVTYDLTMGSVENGTIKAIIGTDTIGAGNTGKVIPGSTVTLVAVPDAGYQLSGWKSGSAAIGDVPQSVMTTTVMPTEAMNVSAAFVAQPEAPTAVTAEKSWTFDSFTTDTRLSGSTIYEYNGLYISGHRSDYANQATVKAGTASGDMGGTTVEASKYLSLAGGQDGNLAATRTVNSFTQDAVALKTGTTGTLYVLMAGTVPTEGDRYFNIYVNGKKHQTKITDTEPVVVSQVITDEEAQVFIATSGGQDNIYAIKFVPATMETVEIENGSEFVAIIDDEEATLADIDITEGTKAITISGTVDGKPVTSMTDNAFTEDNSEGLKAVDLSNTKIALSGDVRAEGGILASLPEETIVYLPTTSSGATGTNVVIKQSDGAFTCEDFQLFDEKPIVIPEGKEFTATDAKLNRPFNMGKKCTVCLPYDFPATGGNFFEFTGISAEGKVQMTQRTGTLNSNTPYIFEPASDATAISAHSDTGSLEISISDAPETKNDAYHFTFKGTYDKVKWDTPQEDVVIYGFAAEARGSASIGQFVRGGVGASILPFRAYLEYNGTSRLSGVRARGSNNAPDYLEVEWIYAEGYGEVTRIDSPEQQDAADAPIYNLRGQRVDDSYKGLIIKNGKVMVRK